MKKIFSFITFAVLMLALQSCLHDDTELFEKSAATRIQESVDETKALLTSSPNGWQVNYYYGEEYSGGGVNMLMRFTDNTVYISSDAYPVDSVSHSTWDIKKDQGVVISVDTYNEILHSMSNPSSSYLNGAEADYEFVVLRSTNDSIYLRGKKWDNHMVMTRMSEGTNWADYLTQVNETYNSLANTYTTSAGTTITFDLTYGRIYAGDDTDGMPFVAKPDGIEFAEAYEIDGQSVTSMSLNKSTNVLTNTVLGTISPVAVPLAEQVINGVFYLGPEGMSTSVLKKCNTLATKMSTAGCTCYFLSLGKYYSSSTKYSFNIGLLSGSTIYQTYSQFDVVTVDDTTIQLTNGTFDSIGNGEYIYNYYGGKDIFEMFGLSPTVTTWKLSTDNVYRPTYIRFENADDADEYFCAYTDAIIYPFE